MTEKKRFAVFPDVPTLDESGVPGYGLFDLPISRYLDLPTSRPPEFTGLVLRIADTTRRG